MARSASRPGPPSLLFGVFGQGEVAEENFTSMMDDYIEGQGKITPRFLFFLDKDMWTDTVAMIHAYVNEKGYEYDVVYDATPRAKALKDVLEGAANSEKAEGDDAPLTQDILADIFLGRLMTANDAVLLFLWAGDEDGVEYDQRVLTVAGDNSVTALDVCEELNVIDIAPAANSDTEPEPAADEPAAEPAGDDGPSFEEISSWPERRIRDYTKECELDPELGDGAPVEALLKWLSDPDTSEDDVRKAMVEAAEPAKPAGRRPRGRAAASAPAGDGDEAQTRVTPSRARQVREEIESEPTGDRAARRRQRPTDEAEPAAEPTPDTEGAAGEGLTRLVAVLVDLGAAETDEEVAEALATTADAFADVIIDRIAARVEQEPEGSDIRKEVAPPRPPGRTPKGGGAPTRRARRG